MKILVVESDIIVKSLMKVKINRIFGSFPDFDCVTVSSLDQGAQAFAAIRPDIVIFDLNMPGLEYASALECISRFSDFASVIVMGDETTYQIKKDCYLHGASEIIEKNALSSEWLREKIFAIFYKRAFRQGKVGVLGGSVVSSMDKDAKPLKLPVQEHASTFPPGFPLALPVSDEHP